MSAPNEKSRPSIKGLKQMILAMRGEQNLDVDILKQFLVKYFQKKVRGQNFEIQNFLKNILLDDAISRALGRYGLSSSDTENKSPLAICNEFR